LSKVGLVPAPPFLLSQENTGITQAQVMFGASTAQMFEFLKGII